MNVKKLGYYKPVKPNKNNWYIKRQTRKGMSREGGKHGKTLGKQLRSA